MADSIGAAGQVVSRRLSAEELQAFDALCGQLGATSRSDGLRAIVRMAAASRVQPGGQRALEEIRQRAGKDRDQRKPDCWRQTGAGRRWSRRSGQRWKSLRRSLPMVAKARSQIIAERRRQGVALFRKFVETQRVRAAVKLGSRPIGLAEAVLGDFDFLRLQSGRVKPRASSHPGRVSEPRRAPASQWRFSLGSNAAVIKRIGKGWHGERQGVGDADGLFVLEVGLDFSATGSCWMQMPRG